MRITYSVALVAAILGLACGESKESEEGATSGAGNDATTGAQGNSNTTGAEGNSNTDGAEGRSNTGDDGGPSVVADDPATPGNDSPTAVSCGGAEGSEIVCSLATHSCCVTGFAADAASCLDGTTCAQGTGNRTECDGPEDCGEGFACCVNITAGTSACAQGACPLLSIAKMCHTDADCDASKVCTRGDPKQFGWWGNCN